ncbi:MAG: N-acetylmuramoyl-L-alanine amidase [Planctomycetota bacterium]|jgi:hypothetical protein
MRAIDMIVVHHSASALTTTAADIARWHSAPKPIGRGWRLGTGYHRIIEADGAILDGRKMQHQGAHAKGHNRNSIGICAIGNNTDPNQRWTLDQDESLRSLLWFFRRRYPDASMLGHRDVPGASTLCPGVDFAEWMRVHGIS